MQKVSQNFIQVQIPLKYINVPTNEKTGSHLRYGIVAWCGALKAHSHPAEELQRRFLRLLTSRETKYLSDALYLDSNVLDMHHMFYYNTVIKYPRSKRQFSLPSHTNSTRQKHRYSIPSFLSYKNTWNTSNNLLLLNCTTYFLLTFNIFLV